jgi:hypothetical protein
MSIADFVVHAVNNGVIDMCSVMEAARRQLLAQRSESHAGQASLLGDVNGYSSDQEMAPAATPRADAPSGSPPPAE